MKTASARSTGRRIGARAPTPSAPPSRIESLKAELKKPGLSRERRAGLQRQLGQLGGTLDDAKRARAATEQWKLQRAEPAHDHRLGQLRRARRRRPRRGAFAGGRCGAMVGQGRWYSARAGVRRGAAARQYRHRRVALFLHRRQVGKNNFQNRCVGDFCRLAWPSAWPRRRARPEAGHWSPTSSMAGCARRWRSKRS